MDIPKAKEMFRIANKALIYCDYIYELTTLFRIEKLTKVNKLNQYMK